jgi:hypothetical protein
MKHHCGSIAAVNRALGAGHAAEGAARDARVHGIATAPSVRIVQIDARQQLLQLHAIKSLDHEYRGCPLLLQHLAKMSLITADNAADPPLRLHAGEHLVRAQIGTRTERHMDWAVKLMEERPVDVKFRVPTLREFIGHCHCIGKCWGDAYAHRAGGGRHSLGGGTGRVKNRQVRRAHGVAAPSNLTSVPLTRITSVPPLEATIPAGNAWKCSSGSDSSTFH